MTLEGIQNAFYILSTGKYLDNWGAYGSCMDSAKGEYWMATVTGNLVSEGENAGPQATFRTGLCVPAGCSVTDMEHLNGIFHESAEFNNMTADSISISYSNMNSYFKEQREFDASKIAFIPAMLIFVGLVGVATTYSVLKWGDRTDVGSTREVVVSEQETRQSLLEDPTQSIHVPVEPPTRRECEIIHDEATKQLGV
jgi:hypothetical protein